MRRLITIATITISLIILNYVVPINFIFETEKLNTSLFKISSEPDMDPNIVILNIGDLKDFETADKIDSIILQRPRAIGLDLCDIKMDSLLRARTAKKALVTILNCSSDSKLSSNVLTYGGDDVSRFKTDNPDYFEIRLTGSWDKIKERGNQDEFINFKGTANRFTTIDLKDVSSISLQDKIVLISYLGSTVPTDIYTSNLLETGLHQIQYSAFIISTIINNDYINESNFILNAVLIIVAVLLNYWLLTILPVRNTILLTIIAYVLMALINAGLIGLVFILFYKGYYLHTNGLTSILVITTLYTCLTKIETK